jgi:hypothetical protein
MNVTNTTRSSLIRDCFALFEGHANANDSLQTLPSDRVTLLIAKTSRYKLCHRTALVRSRVTHMIRPQFRLRTAWFCSRSTHTTWSSFVFFFDRVTGTTRFKRYLRTTCFYSRVTQTTHASLVFLSLGFVLGSCKRMRTKPCLRIARFSFRVTPSLVASQVFEHDGFFYRPLGFAAQLRKFVFNRLALLMVTFTTRSKLCHGTTCSIIKLSK